jgi:hypothetical protein
LFSPSYVGLSSARFIPESDFPLKESTGIRSTDVRFKNEFINKICLGRKLNYLFRIGHDRKRSISVKPRFAKINPSALILTRNANQGNGIAFSITTDRPAVILNYSK